MLNCKCSLSATIYSAWGFCGWRLRLRQRHRDREERDRVSRNDVDKASASGAMGGRDAAVYPDRFSFGFGGVAMINSVRS